MAISGQDTLEDSMLEVFKGTGQMILVVGASIGAMPFAISMDLGYDLISTIRLSAIYPFFSAFLCFFFLRESKKLTEMKK